MNRELRQDLAALTALGIVGWLAWPALFFVGPIVLGTIASNIELGVYYLDDGKPKQQDDRE